ncbi:MAG: Uma2 family endonuclease, partial [Thermosynechococcaceae cyanobacterium]
GPFEETVNRLWLRWCDRQGQVIATGAEGREAEHQRAEAERRRADQLAAQLQELGINPDQP